MSVIVVLEPESEKSMDFNIRSLFEADLTRIGLVWMGLSLYPEGI